MPLGVGHLRRVHAVLAQQGDDLAVCHHREGEERLGSAVCPGRHVGRRLPLQGDRLAAIQHRAGLPLQGDRPAMLAATLEAHPLAVDARVHVDGVAGAGAHDRHVRGGQGCRPRLRRRVGDEQLLPDGELVGVGDAVERDQVVHRDAKALGDGEQRVTGGDRIGTHVAGLLRPYRRRRQEEQA